MDKLITLRMPIIADAGSIAALADELGYKTDVAIMSQRLNELLGHDDQHLCVAEFDGQFAGWIQVHAHVFLESGLRAEIVGLVVDGTHRRHGIGRMLVSDAISWSRQYGAVALVVRSNAIREESHQFYPAIGFELVKSQHVYRRTL